MTQKIIPSGYSVSIYCHIEQNNFQSAIYGLTEAQTRFVVNIASLFRETKYGGKSLQDVKINLEVEILNFLDDSMIKEHLDLFRNNANEAAIGLVLMANSHLGTNTLPTVDKIEVIYVVNDIITEDQTDKFIL
jgi:hypothetical protein